MVIKRRGEKNLTCNLASIKLKAQGYPILPGLRSDPDISGQHWLWDAVQNHLGWVCVPMEDLGKQRKTLFYKYDLSSSSLTHRPPLLYTHTHTVAGRTKQRQPKHRSGVTNPAVDVFPGQASAIGGWESPVKDIFLFFTSSSHLPAANSTPRWSKEALTWHDWARLSGGNRKSAQVGRMWAKFPPSPWTLPSFHLRLNRQGWAGRSEGKCDRSGRLFFLLSVKM